MIIVLSKCALSFEKVTARCDRVPIFTEHSVRLCYWRSHNSFIQFCKLPGMFHVQLH